MKKLICALLALVMVLGLLAGCSGADTNTDANEEAKVITVAASPSPHAEILAVAGEVLAAEGYELKVTEFTDYVVPNNVVENDEIIANYFQHQPYLDDFNAENGTHIVSVSAPHVEPMGIYGGKKSSLDDLKK